MTSQKIKGILSDASGISEPYLNYLSKITACHFNINPFIDLLTFRQLYKQIYVDDFELMNEYEFLSFSQNFLALLYKNEIASNKGDKFQLTKIDTKRLKLPIPIKIEEYFEQITPSQAKKETSKTTGGFNKLDLINKQKKTKSQKILIQNKEKYDSEKWQKASKERILKNWLNNPKAPPSDLIISNYSMNTIDGSNTLLNGATIKFNKGMKYGLVGLNGVGKTTLLKRISRYDIAGIPNSTKILHVEQEIKGDDTTVLDYVLRSDSIREYLLNRKKCLEERIGGENNDDSNEKELVEILEMINEFEIENSENKAIKILTGLGFTENMLKMKTKKLSGGWRMRVSLASALFVSPDLLLLDEPTNHLDFPSVIWLEKYIKNYEKTVIIVSHDRSFLNNVITHVVHFYHESLDYYKGDYSMFEKVFRDNIVNYQKSYIAQRKQIAHIKEFIDKFRYNAKRASMVQSRIKMLNNMVKLQPLREDKKFKMNFPEVDKIPGDFVTIENVDFGYSEDFILLKNVSFTINSSSRIGLMGANGAGKSTLLKLIMGFYQPLKGEVIINQTCRISYFTQHHIDSFDLELSALENMLKMYQDEIPENVENSMEYCRGRLGQFGISQDLSIRKMKFLSGGQKSRVAFCSLVWKNPHLLILDEPTNHLDMETIDSLIEAINNYKGGLLIVSHDQYFLSKVAKEFWALSSAHLKQFNSLQDIKQFVLTN